MCLNVKKTAYPKIARTDIICYKLYEKNPENPNILISPFQHYRYRVKSFPYVLPKTSLQLKKTKDRILANWYIYNGYHSFDSVSSTLGLALIRYENPTENVHTFKCIIPKGSLYWTGTFMKHKGYCSDNLVIIEEIH